MHWVGWLHNFASPVVSFTTIIELKVTWQHTLDPGLRRFLKLRKLLVGYVNRAARNLVLDCGTCQRFSACLAYMDILWHQEYMASHNQTVMH